MIENIRKEIEETKERIKAILNIDDNSETFINLADSIKITPCEETKDEFDGNKYYKEFENYYLNILNNILSVGHFRKELYSEKNLLEGKNSFTDLHTDLVKIDLGPNANLNKLSEQAITNSTLLMEHFKKIKSNCDENCFDTDKAIIDTLKLLLSNYALYAYSKTRRNDKYTV